MDAKGLMIGDWLEVQDTPKYYKVFGIEEMSRGNACRLIYEDWIVDTWCDRVKPITLTEEILKANGFEYDYDAPNLTHDYYSIELEYGDTFWAKVRYDITNNVVDIKTDSIGGVLSQQLRVICQYVHELQHALRLCGLNELADNFVIEKGGNNGND